MPTIFGTSNTVWRGTLRLQVQAPFHGAHRESEVTFVMAPGDDTQFAEKIESACQRAIDLVMESPEGINHVVHSSGETEASQ